MKEKIKKFLIKILPAVLVIAGSFIISFCWSWYHFNRHDVRDLVLRILLIGSGLAVGYGLFRYGFVWAVKKLDRHHFWHTKFVDFLPMLYGIFSLLFVVFLFKNELLSLVYAIGVLGLLFWRLDRLLGFHPNFFAWQKVNRSLFFFFFYFFLVNCIWQYLAYKYYILNINNKYFNIVLFRTVTITMVWLGGFAVAALIYLWSRAKWRLVWLIAWAVLFLSSLFIWSVNVGVLYFSGLYFSPLVLEHTAGGWAVLKNEVVYWLVIMFGLAAVSFSVLFVRTVRAHRHAPKHCWYYYYLTIILLTVGVLGAFSSFKSTPEFLIAKTFYEKYKGVDKNFVLQPYIFTKLKKFGLHYDENNYLVAHREQVFSDDKKLLPEKLLKQKPNIVIFFLESFSARLTDVYNPKLSGVTPNLNKFAEDPETTVFSGYYNASYPTITGIMAQLCSYLPPTGHSEIDTEKRFQTHRLLCLPQILKDNGYQDIVYATAISKDFANKDTIFGRMGIDKVYGETEFKKIISEKPLGWGYTDHQIFPQLVPMMKQKLTEPFLLIDSSVDSHMPFTLSADMPNYLDNKNEVLRAFYSTDDAFGKFWEEFKKSKYYDNTIVILLADHSVYTSAYTAKNFPDEYNKHNEFDEQFFLMRIPNNILPKKVETLSSSIDLAPTLLQILNINTPNSFEGHSVFFDRDQYPNLLGMYERALYINQSTASGAKKIAYGVIGDMACSVKDYNPDPESPLTICELNDFYKWKRSMVEQGRFWENKK